jgi:hypothetical protein
MVRVLEDWVVDEKTGLTALNALSTTYKKSVELAQKSSKAALSLLLVITAFLGFNSMTGNESPVLPIVQHRLEQSHLQCHQLHHQLLQQQPQRHKLQQQLLPRRLSKQRLTQRSQRFHSLVLITTESQLGFSVTDEDGQ